MTGPQYIFNANAHYNTDQIGGDARALLGSVQRDLSIMGSNNNLPQSNSNKLRTSGDNAEGSREGTPTAESSLRTKLEALQERAVTYRANSSEPRQEHYGDFKEHEFVAGEVYRIWHPTNTNVHLSTFLIYSVTGTNMICLRIVQRTLADADYKFRTRHAKLKPVPAADTRRRSSRLSTSKQQTQEDEDAEEYFFRLNRDERMKQDCWVDMIFPWNIDWKDEYLFAFCGCLEQPSFERAKQLHRELYPK